jgi:hypothetical protein
MLSSHPLRCHVVQVFSLSIALLTGFYLLMFVFRCSLIILPILIFLEILKFFKDPQIMHAFIAKILDYMNELSVDPYEKKRISKKKRGSLPCCSSNHTGASNSGHRRFPPLLHPSSPLPKGVAGRSLVGAGGGRALLSSCAGRPTQASVIG